MRARGSSRTGALLPPLGQLTTGDPARLQRHLTAAAGTAAGVEVRNVKDSIYTIELVSFNELTRFCVSVVLYLFYSVYAFLELIEKPVFSHLNDTLLADVPVLAELQVICLNVYVEFCASILFFFLH